MTVLVTVCGAVLAGLFGAAWVVSVADSAPNLSDFKVKQPHYREGERGWEPKR